MNLANFVASNVAPLIVQTLVGSFGVMMRYLLGDKAHGVSIELSEGQPEYIVDTELKIRYGCQHDRIVFERELLEVGFTLSDENAHKQAVAACDKNLNLMQQAGGIGQQIMRQLFTNQQLPDIEVIARQWHMSSRTLRRRLKEEGLSFRGVVNAVKVKKAKQYLIEGRLPITEVAYLLGYKDSANFTRAFKRSEGITPSEFVRNTLSK